MSVPPRQATWWALRPLWLALRPLWLAFRPLWLALRPLWLALRHLQLALLPLQQLSDPLYGKWTDGQTYGRMDGIYPHSTGLRPLSGPLPCYPLRLHNIKEAGQGNR